MPYFTTNCRMNYEEFKAAVAQSVCEELKNSIQNYEDWNVYLRNDEDGEENHLVIAEKRKNGWYIVFFINENYTEDYVNCDFSVDEIAWNLVSCFVATGKEHNLIVEK